MKNVIALLLTTAVLCFASCSVSATTLTIAAWEPPDCPDIMATGVMEQFEKEHPGVDVIWETIPWGEYWNKIPVRHAAGSAPDVMWITFGEMDISWMYNGIFAPLDSLIESDKSFDLDDFIPQVVEAGTMDGRLYYIPYRIGFMNWYYNLDMIEREGLVEPKAGWTWDEFLLAAKKLTKRKSDGEVESFGAFVHTWPLMIYEFICGAGGELFSDDSVTPQKAVYNSPEALEGFGFYADLVNQHEVAPRPGMPFGFERGNIGICQMGTQWFSRLPVSSPGMRFSATIAPVGKVPYVAQAGGTGYGIWSASERKELAWELIKALIAPEQLVRIQELDTALVTRRSALAEVKGTCTQKTWDEAAPYFRVVTVVDFNKIVADPLGGAMNRAITENVPYKEVLDEAVRQSNLELEKYHKSN